MDSKIFAQPLSIVVFLIASAAQAATPTSSAKVFPQTFPRPLARVPLKIVKDASGTDYFIRATVELSQSRITALFSLRPDLEYGYLTQGFYEKYELPKFFYAHPAIKKAGVRPTAFDIGGFEIGVAKFNYSALVHPVLEGALGKDVLNAYAVLLRLGDVPELNLYKIGAMPTLENTSVLENQKALFKPAEWKKYTLIGWDSSLKKLWVTLQPTPVK